MVLSIAHLLMRLMWADMGDLSSVGSATVITVGILVTIMGPTKEQVHRFLRPVCV
jgi:hypothetical protein